MQSFFPGRASQSDNLLFLSVDTPETIAQAYELWDGYSGAPGLLGAAAGAVEGESGRYEYDPERRVYIDTRSGRVITEEQLVRYVRKVSDEASRRMKKSTQQLIAGIILLSVWYNRMRSLMRALYKTIWILSIGGFVFDDDFQRNLFYLFVLLQFSYLDNFVEQIETGEQPLNGQAMGRAGLYGGYGNGMWQNIWLTRGEEDGFTEGIRILGDNENHCHDSGERPGCIELADLGWVPIRAVIPIGSATCYTACHCKIKLR